MANIINCLLYYYKLFKRWQWSSCRNKFKVITLTCFFYSFCRNKSQAITKVINERTFNCFLLKLLWYKMPSFALSFEGQLCKFAWVLSLLGSYFHFLFVKKTTMFTVWCRHVHSDWQKHWSICIRYRKP